MKRSWILLVVSVVVVAAAVGRRKHAPRPLPESVYDNPHAPAVAPACGPCPATGRRLPGTATITIRPGACRWPWSCRLVPANK